ncbi:T9SS type A sorting domain-containing protein [Polaribacter sp. MSW13]|uniref:T9SS type A sorting domain-containing protein n=1 Tax=Polaribacter marinus TaxID=2916838 RepID=A0A9X2AM03_9FLAO|nr:T9SS type A sorting domain-containing protein [Polaribacter marinus]MCI2229830.1 T9SS type A sorting domain-containing protein [Polaribacter marinus]
MKAKLFKLMLFVMLSASPLLLQAQTTTYNVTPEIVSGQSYHVDGIVSDITNVPANNPYLNGNPVGGINSLKVGASAANGDPYTTSAIIPFKLPNRPAGKLVTAANLKVHVNYGRQWITSNVDLYGLKYNAASTIDPADHFDAAYPDTTTDVTPIEDDYFAKNVTAGSLDTARFEETNASGDAALVAYINAQYDAGAVAGDYIFLRLNVDNPATTGAHYFGISDGSTANSPTLTIEVEDAAVTPTTEYDLVPEIVSGQSYHVDGIVSDITDVPANNPYLNGHDVGGVNSLKIGASAANGDSFTTSAIIPFKLPNRPAGKLVTAANLKVHVNYGRQWITSNVDLYGLKYNAASTIYSANHYDSSYPDATADVTEIEDDYFAKNVSNGQLDTARFEETSASGDAALVAYINAQYDAGAVAGDYIFLRLNVDNPATPGGNYFGVSDGSTANAPTLTIEVENTAVTITNTWNGGSTDWATSANWSEGHIPTAAENVVIPDLANDPIIGATTGALANDITTNGVLTIANGGSLIVSGTATGNVTYNVAVGDDKWYLISSPVDNQSYNDTWVTNNDIDSGTGNNRGIATYQNGAANATTGQWVYLQAGGSGTFGQGVGYSLKRTAAGSYAFTGEFAYNTKTPAISTGNNNWNLIGNPYASYLDIAKFITENTTTNDNLSDAYHSVYVWDPNNGSGAYTSVTEGFISPGQAFFVHSKVDANASITEAMQSDGTVGGAIRNTVTSIDLNLTNGTSIKKTKINYAEGTTTSLDPGFDIGMFNGLASDLRIYTQLLNNNEGISFSRQALPNSDLENMIVPVGVNAESGQELTFTAAAMNLPSDIKVFLEDRDNNTFTRLDEANSEYAVTLTESLNGIGRFYIHTTPSVLSVHETNLQNISVYTTSASTLQMVGLPQGKTTVAMYNVLGKQVLKTSFSSNGVQELALPKVASGVYIVQLETEKGKLNKKIILE